MLVDGIYSHVVRTAERFELRGAMLSLDGVGTKGQHTQSSARLLAIRHHLMMIQSRGRCLRLSQPHGIHLVVE